MIIQAGVVTGPYESKSLGDTMKALFCGDISPTSDNNHLFAQVATKELFCDTDSLFQAADFSMVNLECALTRAETPIRKIGPAIAAAPETAQVLKELGVTHCCLANNHFYDMGSQGALDSIAALDAAGIGYTGFGENEAAAQKDLVLEKDGVTLCVIAVCEHEYSYALPDRMGSRVFDPFETPLQIRSAKEKYDQVVVLYHGGKEQCHYPSPRLLKACHAMAKSGADLILCQHSHCIGCYEIFQDCHIVYGQGNFHFVKETYRDDPQWHQGLAVLYDTDDHQISFVPVVGTDVGIRLADEQEGTAIMDAFAMRSESLQDGTWRDGWHDFCEAHSEMYLRTIGKAYSAEGTDFSKEKFAHYLDCEAHLDVWRELCQTYNLTENA